MYRIRQIGRILDGMLITTFLLIGVIMVSSAQSAPASGSGGADAGAPSTLIPVNYPGADEGPGRVNFSQDRVQQQDRSAQATGSSGNVDCERQQTRRRDPNRIGATKTFDSRRSNMGSGNTNSGGQSFGSGNRGGGGFGGGGNSSQQGNRGSGMGQGSGGNQRGNGGSGRFGQGGGNGSGQRGGNGQGNDGGYHGGGQGQQGQGNGGGNRGGGQGQQGQGNGGGNRGGGQRGGGGGGSNGGGQCPNN